MRQTLVALTGAFCVAVGTPVRAAEFTLRIGSVAPSGTPWSQLLSRVKARLDKESGGRLETKLYIGGKLGSESSLVSRCQKGQVGAIAVSNGAFGSAVPELFATELPYLFDTYASADKALDASTELVRELLAAQGFAFYMWGENGFRHFASKDKQLTTPGALKGLKMRSQPASPHVWMYETLGASAASIAVGDVTTSLANGVVTGYDNTLLYAYATQWHKEIKYVTLSGHIYQAAIVAYCKPWFDTLPADLQKVLLTVPGGETALGRAAVRAMDKVLEDQYTKAGVEVRKLTASERAAFKSATEPVTQKFLAGASAKGKQLLELLKKHR